MEKLLRLKAFQEIKKLNYFGLLFPPTEQNILLLMTSVIKVQMTLSLRFAPRWKIEEFHARIQQRARARVLPMPSGKKSKKSHCLCYVSLESFEKNGKYSRENY